MRKGKIGLVLALFRRNSTPSFCALLPQVLNIKKGIITLIKSPYVQEENLEENEPGGFHLVQLPFADDIRSAPIEEATRGMQALLFAAHFSQT